MARRSLSSSSEAVTYLVRVSRQLICSQQNTTGPPALYPLLRAACKYILWSSSASLTPHFHFLRLLNRSYDWTPLHRPRRSFRNPSPKSRFPSIFSRLSLRDQKSQKYIRRACQYSIRHPSHRCCYVLNTAISPPTKGKGERKVDMSSVGSLACRLLSPENLPYLAYYISNTKYTRETH